jgi:hypothetical protein
MRLRACVHMCVLVYGGYGGEDREGGEDGAWERGKEREERGEGGEGGEGGGEKDTPLGPSDANLRPGAS